MWFHLPHAPMIRLLRDSGFVVEVWKARRTKG